MEEARLYEFRQRGLEQLTPHLTRVINPRVFLMQWLEHPEHGLRLHEQGDSRRLVLHKLWERDARGARLRPKGSEVSFIHPPLSGFVQCEFRECFH